MPVPRSRSTDPVLVAACRTPIGTAGHALAELTVTELAAPVLAEVAVRAAPLGLPVDEVILGNCLGPGGNPARSAALAAGLGTAIPAVTVDRQCGSGLEAVRQAAALVAAGQAGLVLAGGAESASTAPWRFWPPEALGRPPERYTRAPFAPPGFPDPDMGVAADDLARIRGITRERQDGYAARSHRRALAAAQAGRFGAEIVALKGISVDERPRPLTPERLTRLRPAFRPDGTVTAGNSSGISDGAAAVAVATAAAASAAGVTSLRIVASAVVAGDPALPGASAAPAARKALQRAGIAVADLGAVEVTEAFAAVALAFADELGIDQRALCIDGGAIALGHPWGASGAVLLVRLMTRMLADDGPVFGLAACAIGGGQGVAMVVQRA
jgi:acetyl-CoA C-acetyltransferase